MHSSTLAQTHNGAGAAQKRPVAMSKFSFHTDRSTATRLNNELPDGEEWGEYILECVELRKRVEGRELVLTEPDTRTVDERE